MARQAEPRAAIDDRGRYARSVGHIFPGRCRSGEVRCESGAVPQLRCPARGRVRSTVLRRNERSPRRKGGSGGPGRRASSSADAEVFVRGQTIDSRPERSPRLGEAAALRERPRAPFALSWSGGKDSALVLWTLRRQLFEPEALITTVTETYERISMHGVRRELLARQAEARGLRGDARLRRPTRSRPRLLRAPLRRAAARSAPARRRPLRRERRVPHLRLRGPDLRRADRMRDGRDRRARGICLLRPDR